MTTTNFIRKTSNHVGEYADLFTFNGKTLDRFQSAFVRAVLHGSGNLVGEAVAGSGKSFCLEAILANVDKRLTTLVIAFAKRDQLTLTERCGNTFSGDILTCHSMGMRVIARRFGRTKVDKNKGFSYAEKALNDAQRENGIGEILKAMKLGKSRLAENPEEIEEICETYGIGDKNFPPDEIAPIAWQAIVESREDTNRIDFDDMVYFPWVYDIRVSDCDLVLVDEAQDQTPAQIWLTRSRVKPDGRLVCVGDRHQAIYGWAGADERAIPRMVEEMSAKVLPLSQSYRCPRVIADKLEGFFPEWEFLVPETAPEGEIQEGVSMNRAIADSQPGDLWMSRVNAPLVKLCLGFLQAGKPANIAGRDICKTLNALIKKSRTRETPAFIAWLGEYQAKEIERLNSLKGDATKRIETLTDTCEVLETLSEGTSMVSEIRENMNRIFVDTEAEVKTKAGKSRKGFSTKRFDPSKVITLSTVHRQKGGEARRVFMLEDTFKPDRSGEDKRIYYVAMTRTQETLTMVTRD